MTIPDYQTVMLPLLEAVADGREYRISDLADGLATRFDLSDEERAEVLPSGRTRVFYSRLQWAKTYLSQAGLLEASARGVFHITDEGKRALATQPEKVDVRYLTRFDRFRAFLDRSRRPSRTGEHVAETTTQTPEEVMERAWNELRRQTAAEVLDLLRNSSPAFFEQVVVDLLVGMGYGGSLTDAGESIGRSGDGGIDGIIKEDRLGLDAIYVQAKRWQDTVGRPVVQAFAGSLEGVRAKKGVLITTSSFSTEAKEYVRMIEKRIVLIDGTTLADLLVDYGVGVTTARSYAVPRIDLDYFEPE